MKDKAILLQDAKDILAQVIALKAKTRALRDQAIPEYDAVTPENTVYDYRRHASLTGTNLDSARHWIQDVISILEGQEVT